MVVSGDVNVKYVHKVPLITGFCYSESLFCLFNVCFRVNRENIRKMSICTSQVNFGDFQCNSEKSTVTFQMSK